LREESERLRPFPATSSFNKCIPLRNDSRRKKRPNPPLLFSLRKIRKGEETSAERERGEGIEELDPSQEDRRLCQLWLGVVLRDGGREGGEVLVEEEREAERDGAWRTFFPISRLRSCLLRLVVCRLPGGRGRKSFVERVGVGSGAGAHEGLPYLLLQPQPISRSCRCGVVGGEGRTLLKGREDAFTSAKCTTYTHSFVSRPILYNKRPSSHRCLSRQKGGREREEVKSGLKGRRRSRILRPPTSTSSFFCLLSV